MKYTVEENRAWYNQLPAKRSSAGMVLRHQDMVLMVKDDYKPAMTFPGGVIDPEESPRHAAIRETFEETGIQVPDSDVYFLSVAYVPEYEGFLDRYHFFFQVYIEELTALHKTHSIEYIEWVPVAELAEKAGGRAAYITLQQILQTGVTQPYFELTKGGR